MPLAEFLEGDPRRHRVGRPRRVPLRSGHAQRRPTATGRSSTEGFSETYHVQGIHREMLGSMADDVNAPQRLWHRHGVSYQPYGVPSPAPGSRPAPTRRCGTRSSRCMGGRIGVDDGTARPMPPIPEGETLRDVIAQNGPRRDHAAQGIDLSRFTTTTTCSMHGAVQPVPEHHRARVRRHAHGAARRARAPRPTSPSSSCTPFCRAPAADAPRTQPFDVPSCPPDAAAARS